MDKDDNNDKNNDKKYKKHQTKFTLQEELVFIKEAKETSNYKVAERFGVDVDVSTVRYWRDNEESFMASDNKYDRKTVPRKIENTELEDLIYNKIIDDRNEGKQVSTQIY